MRRTTALILSFAITATCLAAQCKTINVIPLSEITNETLQELFEGKRPNIALECSEGLNLPLTISISGDMLDAVSDGYTSIKVLKNCYIRCEKGFLLFSTDLNDWKDFSTFFTGSIGFSLSVENEEPTASLNCELNQRD